MSVIPRTHRVDVYRPTTAQDAWNAEADDWPGSPTIAAVDCNLQPRRTDFAERGYGQLAEGAWAGFFPPGTALKEGDGLQVTTVLQGGQSGPARFRVTGLGPQGEDWDLECDVEVSMDSFGS